MEGNAIPGPAAGDDLLPAALAPHSPAELLEYACSRFGARAALGTSFQHSGLVLLDLARRAGLRPLVFTLDTLHLPAETYAHIAAVERHFGIEVQRIRPDPEAVGAMVRRHGEFLFFDSPDKRRLCCRVRKDEPNARVMANLDCWITGVRRDQSADRATTREAEISRKYGRPILKLSPLAAWTEEQVQRYVDEHGLPVHPLYALGYRSLGCTICTTPVRPGESARAGRWRWERDGAPKECGLHVEQGAGI